jgi:hypothetical protein
MISNSVLRAKIAHKASKYKNQTEAAAAFGMTQQNLSQILTGHPITNEEARLFGYRLKERFFEKIKEK